MPHFPQIPIAFGARVRPSPYFEATLRQEPGAFSVYNRMLMPAFYRSVEDDYWDLVERVSVWDVGCERQVEITGPDAAAFTQYLVTRDVTRLQPGRARYTLVCQEDGGILNDPVVLRLGVDHFWLSLSDSDIQLWAKGVAHNSGLSVEIREPDVSPLQVQGPLSVDVMRELLGPIVDDLGFYHFIETNLEGVPIVVARTGWSGEVGFELFLRDGSRGSWLWERVFEVGEPFGIAAGAPNNIRRMEAGLLSWGTDMDWNMNPIEMGLERFVDLDSEEDFIGKAAITAVAQRGPDQRHVGLIIRGDPIRQGPLRWWPVRAGDAEIGFVTSAAWSPGMEQNIAFAMLHVEAAQIGNQVEVQSPDGTLSAVVTPVPFVEPRYRD